MSGNLTAVREMPWNLLKVREMSGGGNLAREKFPKTVYCKSHICVHTGILVGVYSVLNIKVSNSNHALSYS